MQNPIHMKNNTLNNSGFAALAVGLCCLLPFAAPATAHAQSQLGKNLGENGWGEPGGHAGDHIQLGGDPASSRYNSQLAHTDAKPICELSRDFSGDLPISQLLTTHAVNAASQEDSAQAGQNKPPRQMDFTADKVEYDSQQDIVTASGDVLVESNGQKLEAQKIVWNCITGDVSAFDQVKITHDDGTVIYGEHINLKDNLEVGTVENILLVLEEGARIVARSAERRPDEVLLNYATYSPCAVTDDEGNPKNPSWQIRAVKVRYDEVKQRVHYDGARIEFFGLPVISLPGLSHPVGGKSDSGLLVPNVRLSETNGLELELPYYFKLSENRDVTITPTLYTDALPMIAGQYRALTSTGAYQITGYATGSRRIPVGENDTANTPSVYDFRGYLDANGKFQLDDKWTVSASIRRTTDRTFLRRYDISFDDRLRSNVNVARVDDQSYFSLTGWATQTLRANADQGQVPVALPVFDWQYRPRDTILGGKAQVQVNTLAIGRSDGQDTQRAFAQAPLGSHPLYINGANFPPHRFGLWRGLSQQRK